MSTKEELIIQEFKNFRAQGIFTEYELDWCLGAIRNRHGLSKETRHQLRDTVKKIISDAFKRYEQNET
jgi:hypothetical protein